ncbi:MAG: glycoside hydrolase family 3 N-terminal domain-containing protein [Fluviicola sp.]
MKYWIFLLGFISLNVVAQDNLKYKNPNLPIQVRVNDLLSRMTPEEKFRQLFMVAGELGKDSMQFYDGLFGFQINTLQLNTSTANQLMTYSAGPSAKITLDKINQMQNFFVNQTRLGIPMIAFDEALHGLVRKDATSFPQSIALAASFDTILMNDVSLAIALECKARGLRMILSPVINLATDVRWGRVEETYGEDPYLSSLFGVSYVRAMESNGIITTPKHFVVNHGEGGRDSYPIYWNERWMRETYFKPFKAVVQKAGARSIMTAYNSYDGKPCTANNYLLNDVLRKQWGFSGFVISDAAATGGANVLHFTATDYEDAGKQSIENGLDVIFQTDFSSYPLFKVPFLNGSVNHQAIDSAVTHVLKIKFELGLFENPYVSENLLQSIDVKKHRELAYQMAVKSAVLLRNENNFLPLKQNGYQKIAVIGPDANEARLGGYSGPGNNPISILDGLRYQSELRTEINYSKGCERIEVKYLPIEKEVLFHIENNVLKSGLMGSYFTQIDFLEAPVFQRIDEQINFQWTLFGPEQRLPYDHYAVKWEGVLIPTESGEFEIGIEGNDGYKFYLNDELLIDCSKYQGHQVRLKSVKFKKGEQYSIRIEYKERSGNAWFKLVWNAQVAKNSDQKMNEAIKLAKKSDIAIVVVGIEEGEFRDRSSLDLPGRQEDFIPRISETGTPVVVVLVGGSAITMDAWIDKTDAILDVWYPGEMGGDAVAALLFGKENPSGRLPITFPKSVGQVPLVYNHPPTGRGDDYLDGSGQALFPFGFGLSYTDFAYSDLTIKNKTFKENDTVIIQFKVKNIGLRSGEEVVQLYSRDEVASYVRPIKELKAFQRVKLEAGEEKILTFKVTASDFAYPMENLIEETEPGFFRIMIGASSKDIRLRELIEFVK